MPDLNEQTRRELRELIGYAIFMSPDTRGTPRDPEDWDDQQPTHWMPLPKPPERNDD